LVSIPFADEAAGPAAGSARSVGVFGQAAEGGNAVEKTVGIFSRPGIRGTALRARKRRCLLSPQGNAGKAMAAVLTGIFDGWHDSAIIETRPARQRFADRKAPHAKGNASGSPFKRFLTSVWGFGFEFPIVPRRALAGRTENRAMKRRIMPPGGVAKRVRVLTIRRLLRCSLCFAPCLTA